MASVLNQPFFQNEEAAYAKLESIVWPNGPVCPHCGNTDRVRKLNGIATRPGVHKCYACRKQSRVTVGTVFESSHVPVHMWLQAAYLMCSSKKGISSNQLARTLGVTIKTGWFMSHRLREAMTAGTRPLMGGEGEVVEIDETFIGKKEGEPVRRGYAHKHAVLTLVQRGGSARSFHVDGTKASDLLPIIKANVLPDTHVMTDEAGQYAHLLKHFAAHGFTRHGQGEYVMGITHTKFFRRSFIRVRNVTRKTSELAQDLVWDYSVRPKDAIHLATAMEARISLIETFDDGFIGKSGQIGSPTITIRYPLPEAQRKLL